MSDFAEYVRGRTVAVVGRAPILPGDGEAIDAHDLVYRVGETPRGGAWGERTDVAFLNGRLGREIYHSKRRRDLGRIADATWWVYKNEPNQPRRNGLDRRARRPNIKNPNAVTMMLYDLIRYHEPASVTVFAADLYASGPGLAYTNDVDPREPSGQAKGIIMHRPHEQRRVHKACVKTGLIVGDRRYLDAVSMSDEDYQAIVERWDAVYRSTPATV